MDSFNDRYSQSLVAMHTFDRFLHSVDIVLTQNRFFGSTTVLAKDRKFTNSKTRTILNTVSILTFLLFASYIFYRTVSNPVTPDIYKSTDVILILINSTYTVAVWLHGILNSGKFSRLLTAIVAFDRALYVGGYSVDYERQRRSDILQCVVRYALLAVIEATFLVIRVYLCGEDVPFEVLRNVLLLIKMATCHQVAQIVTVMRRRFEILNAHLRELTQISDSHRRRSRRRFTSLCRICDLHHSLIKINRLFNSTFGVLLLLMFGLSFVTSVVCFFYISASLQTAEVEWKHGSLALILSVPFIGDMLYVCNVCYKTVEEANLVGELIHKIETEDQDVIDEVEMFSLQIYNAPIEFSAAQFFAIDHTLIFSIIGGVTTYIIILIQLSATLLAK